jgi:uncharacterized membrane protein YcjF (UPF0283 family)
MPVTWVAWGLVAAGAVVLVASVMPLTRRMRTLRRAMRRLSWRQEDVQRLRDRAEAMQETLTDLQQRAALTEMAVAAVREGMTTARAGGNPARGATPSDLA